MPASTPVGSPPSEISAVCTRPKPTADAPHAEATPSVGDGPTGPPRPAVVGVEEVAPVEPGVEVDVGARLGVAVGLFCAGGDGLSEHADATSASPTTPEEPSSLTDFTSTPGGARPALGDGPTPRLAGPRRAPAAAHPARGCGRSVSAD